MIDLLMLPITVIVAIAALMWSEAEEFFAILVGVVLIGAMMFGLVDWGLGKLEKALEDSASND